MVVAKKTVSNNSNTKIPNKLFRQALRDSPHSPTFLLIQGIASHSRYT